VSDATETAATKRGFPGLVNFEGGVEIARDQVSFNRSFCRFFCGGDAAFRGRIARSTGRVADQNSKRAPIWMILGFCAPCT
jgi:hypothetical protein